MPTRASRGGKRADFAQNALRVIEEATGDGDAEVGFLDGDRQSGETLKPAEGKNPHAQALSALGASKGGKARAAKLSKAKRKAIAKKAAKTRWGKRP